MAASQTSYECLLLPCNVCGRKFNQASLERHEKICQAASQKKRKVFDSKKQRLPVTDSLPPPPAFTSQTSSKHTEKESPKSTWRDKHEEFIKTIRSVRNVSTGDKPSNPAQANKIPAGYIQCDYCGRNFNIKAADRHISWCKEQKTRVAQNQNLTKVARERLEARTKYKAPSLRKKNSPKIGKTIPKSNSVQNVNNCESGSVTAEKNNSHNKDLERSSSSKKGNGLHKREMDYPVRRTDSDQESGYLEHSNTKHDTFNPNSTTSRTSLQIRSPLQKPRRSQSRSLHHSAGEFPLRSFGKDYNPYAAAEKQMKELMEGSNYLLQRAVKQNLSSRQGSVNETSSLSSHATRLIESQGIARPKAVENFHLHQLAINEHSSTSNLNSTNTNRVHPAFVQNTIQVRDRGKIPFLNRSSRHAFAYSDSDEESSSCIDKGVGDLNDVYTATPLENGNSLIDMGSVKQDYSFLDCQITVVSNPNSPQSQERSPSPTLKLPATRLPTTVKSPTTPSHRKMNNHWWTPGPSNVYASDLEHNVSTSSSDSSLPPLQNSNRKSSRGTYNSQQRHPQYSNFSPHNSIHNNNFNISGDSEVHVSRFCHECGARYPILEAKFCCECGTRRLCMT